MQAARREWVEQQPTLDAARIVFLDETGASTNMARTHGRAPRGVRCIASVPHGHWQTTTFIAGLRVGEISAPMVLDGPMDGEAFLAYVRTFLCPTLTPGDIVIADNLSSPQGCGSARSDRGQRRNDALFTAYSPDLNPIEKMFSKLKALLRKAARRTVETLWEEIGKLLETISPSECENYFRSCGYVYT